MVKKQWKDLVMIFFRIAKMFAKIVHNIDATSC